MTNAITHLADATDILDIRPPVAIPDYWLWLWVGLGAVALAALLVWLIRYFVNRARFVPPPPVIPAHVRARRRLEEALEWIGSPKPFVIAVSDALRVYLEEALALRAPERTTEEFLVDLQDSASLSTAQKERLADFLVQCDLVKFARFEPTQENLRALHTAALDFVSETEPHAETMEPASADAGDQSSIVNRPS